MPQTQRVSKHNTVVIEDNGYTTVILHQTPVVKFNDNEIILNNGGYVSLTTQTRMNQVANEYCLNYYVTRKDGAMYVKYRGQLCEFKDNKVELMRFNHV